MEVDMFIAIIEQAAKDARQGNEEDRTNAIKWLTNGDEDEGFLYMCEFLQVDPDRIITKLRDEGVL